MSNWLHRLFNPHCPHCVEEREESHICKSCETLKTQLDIANHQNKQLMDKLLAPPSIEVAKPPIEMTPQRNIPWNVRRQMLEAEDREKARLIRDAPKPIATEDLEKEMDIVAKEREDAS